MTIKKPEGFDGARKSAEEFVKDKEKTDYLLGEALEKAERNKNSLKKFWGDLQALIGLGKGWITGNYTDVPVKTILLVIAAIIYFVNPFDVVPDFLPGIGYLDDATVIGFVIGSIKDDIEAFKNWSSRDTNQ